MLWIIVKYFSLWNISDVKISIWYDVSNWKNKIFWRKKNIKFYDPRSFNALSLERLRKWRSCLNWNQIQTIQQNLLGMKICVRLFKFYKLYTKGQSTQQFILSTTKLYIVGATCFDPLLGHLQAHQKYNPKKLSLFYLYCGFQRACRVKYKIVNSLNLFIYSTL